MPTQRFLNLKEEKKQIILHAAAEEFSRVSYSAASINQIIHQAGISRGSFYTYFEDKDDLMRYMLRGFRERFCERVFEILEEEKGNPFAVPVRLLKQLIEQRPEGIGYKMYQNMLAYLNVINQNQLFGVRGLLVQDDSFNGFLDHLYTKIDREQYPVKRESLGYAAEMAILVFVKSLAMYYRKVAEKDQILDILESEMRILERGSCAAV